MLVDQISLLLIVPLLLVAYGIFRMMRGMWNNDFTVFKTAFFYFLAGFALSLFLLLVGRNNSTNQVLQGDLSTVFLVAVCSLGATALTGVSFYIFNNFIPTFFTRLSLFLAVFTVAVGGTLSYQSSKKETVNTNQDAGKFKELDGAELNAVKGTLQLR